MDGIIISFVIPVFNQTGLLKLWLDRFVIYQGGNVEVVICGGGEGLDELITQYSDKRIKLYEIDNRGQDLNILEGIRRCKGKYIWLFRTKDYVISEKIEEVISILYDNPSISYMTSSCIDEEDNYVLKYEPSELVRKGHDAILRHGRLYVHPSGSIYRRDCIDIAEMERFLIDETDARVFIYLCSLMRLCCALQGDFFLMDKVTWIYTNTIKSATISGNFPNKTTKFIYDPEYTYMRYKAETKFAYYSIKDRELLDYTCARIFGRYLIECTWFLWKGYRDDGFCKHYGVFKKEIKMEHERSKYLGIVEKIERLYGLQYHESYTDLKAEYISKNIDYCNKLIVGEK